MTKQTSPLGQRMIEDMAMRNMAPTTQHVYTYAVANFARYHHKSPDQLGLEEVRSYRLHLLSRGLEAKSINPIVGGLRQACAAEGYPSDNKLKIALTPNGRLANSHCIIANRCRSNSPAMSLARPTRGTNDEIRKKSSRTRSVIAGRKSANEGGQTKSENSGHSRERTSQVRQIRQKKIADRRCCLPGSSRAGNFQ